MSKFCPEWIFGIFAAQTSKEFLSSNNSIAAVGPVIAKRPQGYEWFAFFGFMCKE
jgi:hypothetical protein